MFHIITQYHTFAYIYTPCFSACSIMCVQIITYYDMVYIIGHAYDAQSWTPCKYMHMYAYTCTCMRRINLKSPGKNNRRACTSTYIHITHRSRNQVFMICCVPWSIHTHTNDIPIHTYIHQVGLLEKSLNTCNQAFMICSVLVVYLHTYTHTHIYTPGWLAG
jgi:hypothetical protein